MTLKSFVLSKIKEGFAEDFFTYLKFQKPNGGRMHINNFSLSYVTESFCDLSGAEELSPCVVYSGGPCVEEEPWAAPLRSVQLDLSTRPWGSRQSLGPLPRWNECYGMMLQQR